MHETTFHANITKHITARALALSVIGLAMLGSTGAPLKAQFTAPAAVVLIDHPMSFDGLTDYIDFGQQLDVFFGSPGWEIEFVMLPDVGQAGFVRIFDNGSFRVYLDSFAGSAYVRADIVGTGVSLVSRPISLGQLVHVSVIAHEFGSGIFAEMRIGGKFETAEFAQVSLPIPSANSYVGTSAVSPGGLLYSGELSEMTLRYR